MSSEPFEYDVFISFASTDQDLVRPLWQELTLSGLRVFWSDSSLRDRVGTSWFEIIQDSLTRSRHFVGVFTPTALQSNWVKREWGAFLTHCHRPPERLLVPVLAAGCTYTDLSLFLRELEACHFDDRNLAGRLARLLGGIDIEALRQELAKTRDELSQLREEHDALTARNVELEQRSAENQRQHAEAAGQSRKRMANLESERDALRARVAELEQDVRVLEHRRDKDSLAIRTEREAAKKLQAELDRLRTRMTELTAGRDSAPPVQAPSVEAPSQPALPVQTTAVQAPSARSQRFVSWLNVLFGTGEVDSKETAASKLWRVVRRFLLGEVVPRSLRIVRRLLVMAGLAALAAFALLGTVPYEPYANPSELLYVLPPLVLLVMRLTRNPGRRRYFVLLIGILVLGMLSIADSGTRYADEIVFRYGFGESYYGTYRSLLPDELRIAIPLVAVQGMLAIALLMTLFSPRIRAYYRARPVIDDAPVRMDLAPG
jgi:hypothetical protein